MADNVFSQAPMSTYYGFGINPAYTTPAYMSNFRPAYASDSDPFNPYSQNRGYFEALKNQYMFNPMGTYASDPSEDERANNWAINTMHSDALVNGVTKVGVPLAAWYAANKFFGMKVGAHSPTSGLWDRGAAYAGAIYRGQGMGAAAAAWSGVAARQSLGAAAGSVAGRGAGRFLGGMIGGAGRLVGLGGALGGAGTVLGGAGAVAGGLIGGIAAPIIAGAGIAKAANYYASEPYVGIRRGEDAMLANTANTFVGGSAAPHMGSFGISARHANSLSQAFMESNIKDMGFKPGDYSAMADYGMQAGLFNDIGNMNVDQMKKRVEGMADAVKMIMAVANTNSVKEAIQYMGRLKAAGVSNPGAVARVMSEMGLASGISGASAEQIMNTVGNQGQMIAQRLGMLPVMGQRQAASIYSGFANAYKSGAMNSADMAALGGVEGATQYALEGAGRIFSTPYFKAAINSGAVLGSGSMLGVSQAFGSRRAENPLQSFGDDILNGGVNTSKYLEKHSTMETVMNFLFDQTNNLPSAKMKDGSGRNDLRATMGWAVTNGLLSEEEARTYSMQFKMMKDPAYQRRMQQAAQGTADKQLNQWVAQQGYDTLSGVPGVGRAWQSLRELNRDVLSGSSGAAGAFTAMRASMADSWDSFQSKLQGRRNERDRPVARYSMENGVQTRTELDIGSYQSFNGNETRMTSSDGVLKEIAKDIANEDPTSELGKLAQKLKANLGKNIDNRADLDKYYRMKKGDVGAAEGTTRSQYVDQANRAWQTAKLTETKTTANDVNPKVSDDFLSAYAESISGPAKLAAQKEYWNSSEYKNSSTLSKWNPFDDGFEKHLKGSFDKGDGARVFNATVRSMRNTGRADLEDLYEAGGDGATSYFSQDFGKLLTQYKKDPSKMSDQERSRVEEFRAMQKMSGMEKSATDKIEAAIEAQGRGDSEKAGILYGKEGDEYREAISSNVERTMKNMDVGTLRKGYKWALSKNGYTGADIDAMDARTDGGIESLTLNQQADLLKKGGEITDVARDEVNRAKNDTDRLSKMFGGEEFIKSFGEVANGIGKATTELSGSAEALSQAASDLSAAAKAGGTDPQLAKAVENLNNTLKPLVQAVPRNGLPRPGAGVSNNFGAQQ